MPLICINNHIFSCLICMLSHACLYSHTRLPWAHLVVPSGNLLLKKGHHSKTAPTRAHLNFWVLIHAALDQCQLNNITSAYFPYIIIKSSFLCIQLVSMVLLEFSVHWNGSNTRVCVFDTYEFYRRRDTRALVSSVLYLMSFSSHWN